VTFETELRLALLPDGRRWYLTQPLVWHGAIDGRRCTLTVPARFVTDGASVPRLLWPFAAPWGRHGRAAVLHDFLYFEQNVTRREADLVFRIVMAEARQLVLVRWAMWAAVRLFGWIAWSGNAEDRARGLNRVLAEDEIPAPDAVAPKRGLDRVISVLCRLCGRAA
jgi:hypothetical protein